MIIIRIPIRIICFFIFIILLSTHNIFPQDKTEREEIPVSLHVQGMGTAEIPALLLNQEIHLSINDLFDFLKIANVVSTGMDSVNGYFINTKTPYLIDNLSHRIHFQDTIYHLKNDDLIKTETGLYLRTNYFDEVFGLACKYNFRTLSVVLNTKAELPLIKEMRLEKTRKHVRRLKYETKVDSNIRRDFKIFQLGTADWSIYNTRQLQNRRNDSRIYLSLGGSIAGGEAKAAANYYTNMPFSEKQLYYSWRYADNENNFLRQATAGKIYAQSTSTIYAPVIGVQLTNAPTTIRRFWGYYTLSDYTGPGWMVELFLNDIQTDYVKADDSGFFSFKIPLIYGDTQISLRFYGPQGEERTKSQKISIPYNFLPQREIEYTFTSGVIEDRRRSFYSRVAINYGVSKSLTIGGGIEHLSTITSLNTMPYLKASFSPGSGLVLSSEYMYGVRSKGMLNYRSASNFSFELNYTVYDKKQKAVSPYNLEERKVVISLPLRLGRYNMFSRLNLNQIIMHGHKFTDADLLLSSFVLGVSASLSTKMWILNSGDPFAVSRLAFTYMLPERIIIRPQIQYDYKLKEISSIKCGIEKQLSHRLNMSADFEKGFSNKSFYIQLGARYELPFLRTGSTFNYSNNRTSISQSASGSFMYDGNACDLAVNSRTSVGRCGAVISPFLDMNGNGLRDLNEPKAAGVSINIDGGRFEYNSSDTTARIYDLEPYTKYFIKLLPKGFDNIAWHINKPSLSVTVNPNEFKLIEVPVSILGEVSGKVYLSGNNGKKGLGGVYVCFYSKDSTLAARILSEGDGFFSYLGLKPGTYTVRIDAGQLETLQMSVFPYVRSFKIKPISEGDVVDELEFTLEHLQLE